MGGVHLQSQVRPGEYRLVTRPVFPEAIRQLAPLPACANRSFQDRGIVFNMLGQYADIAQAGSFLDALPPSFLTDMRAEVDIVTQDLLTMHRFMARQFGLTLELPTDPKTKGPNAIPITTTETKEIARSVIIAALKMMGVSETETQSLSLSQLGEKVKLAATTFLGTVKDQTQVTQAQAAYSALLGPLATMQMRLGFGVFSTARAQTAIATRPPRVQLLPTDRLNDPLGHTMQENGWCIRTLAGNENKTYTEKRNNDYAGYAEGPNFKSWVLCDGMGSHLAGDEVSQIATKTFQEVMVKRLDLPILGRIMAAIDAAQAAVLELDKKFDATIKLRPSTTLTALILDEENNRLYAVNIGDSIIKAIDQVDGISLSVPHNHQLEYGSSQLFPDVFTYRASDSGHPSFTMKKLMSDANLDAHQENMSKAEGSGASVTSGIKGNTKQSDHVDIFEIPLSQTGQTTLMLSSDGPLVFGSQNHTSITHTIRSKGVTPAAIADDITQTAKTALEAKPDHQDCNRDDITITLVSIAGWLLMGQAVLRRYYRQERSAGFNWTKPEILYDASTIAPTQPASDQQQRHQGGNPRQRQQQRPQPQGGNASNRSGLTHNLTIRRSEVSFLNRIFGKRPMLDINFHFFDGDVKQEYAADIAAALAMVLPDNTPIITVIFDQNITNDLIAKNKFSFDHLLDTIKKTPALSTGKEFKIVFLEKGKKFVIRYAQPQQSP